MYFCLCLRIQFSSTITRIFSFLSRQVLVTLTLNAIVIHGRIFEECGPSIMHVQLFYFYELLINFDKSEKGREGGSSVRVLLLFERNTGFFTTINYPFSLTKRRVLYILGFLLPPSPHL